MSAPDGGFRGCLLSKGVRLPEDERRGGNEERLRTAIEACAPQLMRGEVVRIPMVKGSAFQICLAGHGVKLPAQGEWLRINRAEDPVMDEALKQC
jgi:hypothetical protein